MTVALKFLFTDQFGQKDFTRLTSFSIFLRLCQVHLDFSVFKQKKIQQN